MRISIVCNKNLEVNEYNLILAFSEYKVIWKKYNNLLDGNDNLSFVLTFPWEEWAHMCMHLFSLQSNKHIQYDMIIWSHRSKLASFQTANNLFNSNLKHQYGVITYVSVSISRTGEHFKNKKSTNFVYVIDQKSIYREEKKTLPALIWWWLIWKEILLRKHDSFWCV